MGTSDLDHKWFFHPVLFFSESFGILILAEPFDNDGLTGPTPEVSPLQALNVVIQLCQIGVGWSSSPGIVLGGCFVSHVTECHLKSTSAFLHLCESLGCLMRFQLSLPFGYILRIGPYGRCGRKFISGRHKVLQKSH